MTRLQRLHEEQDQSPWLDNLPRSYLRDGTLARLVNAGVRGVTANPTILAKAIEGSDAYDIQFAQLIGEGRSVTEAYWELVIDDIIDALRVLRLTFDASNGTDGFVSIEVAPELARDTNATISAARQLHQRIDQPNLYVKIPANAVAGYYGDDAGTKLTTLLKAHIATAGDIITAAKAHDDAAVTKASTAWYANADEIATFLAGANPAWPEATLKDMMHTHLDQTLAEATAQLTGDYTKSVTDYDHIVTHIIDMADALSSGIVTQFPDKFSS